MTIFQLVLKLVADLRSKNGQALATILQLLALLFGFNPIPVPTPNPEAPRIMAAATAAETNAVADELEALVNAPGAQANGVFIGKLVALLIRLIPLLIG